MSTGKGRKSLGSISQRSARDEYNISSLIGEVSPALRRRSRVPASPPLSPVFARKALLSGRSEDASAAGIAKRKALLCGRSEDAAAAAGIARRKAWLAFESASPVLGRRNRPQHKGEGVAGAGNRSLSTDGSPRPLPLRERKNTIGAGRASSKGSAKKRSVAPDTMSKENVQPLRKSARTKKVPQRFIASKLCGKEASAKKNNSPDTKGVDLPADFDGPNVKGKLNKLIGASAKKNNSPDTRGVDLQADFDGLKVKGKLNQKSVASKKGIPSPRENGESTDDAVSESGAETQSLEPAKDSSQESQGNVTRRKPRVSPSETFSDFAMPKNSASMSTQSRWAKQKGQSSTSKEKGDPKSNSTERTAVGGGIPSGSSVPPQTSERSVAATPRLSKRETLRQMILNGTLPIRGSEKERGPFGMKSNSRKMLNSTGTYLSSKSYTRQQKSALKRQESAEVPPKETPVRAGRSRESKRNRIASNAVAVQGEVCYDARKENTNPKEIAKENTNPKEIAKENTNPKEIAKENANPKEIAAGAGKRQRKCRTKATEKETPMGSSSSVTPLRHESNPIRQDPGSGNLGLVKKKPPVWVAESGSPSVGRRTSIRRKSNLYDFSASPVKNGAKKPRKQYRPRARTKDPKQKCKLKSVLVTDPQWKNPLAASSSMLAGESMRSGAGGESTRSVASTERIFDEEFYARMNSAVSEDYGSDDNDNGDVYERDEGNIFEMFEGGTASSFIPSRREESSAVPMASASGYPTPAYRKQLDKYLGSSTPRVEAQSFVSQPKQPATVEDDIAKCFGFENDDDNDEEYDDGSLSLNLSPVRQSGQQSHLQSHLNMTINSDIMTSINHSTASQPYRFSWGPMRPGNFSYNSSRSSSMVVHGRSKDKSASSSLSGVSASSFQSSASRPLVTVRTRGRPRLAAQRKSRETPQAGKNVAEGTHDVSVLFDEEEERDGEVEANKASPVKQSSGDIRPYLSRNLGKASPEKSMIKNPRKSYDRHALVEAKKKFEKEFGGAGTTEAETEEDMSMQSETPKRKKKTAGRKKLAKKPKVAESHDDTTEGSQSSESAGAGNAPPKKRIGPKKKVKGSGLDKSIHDWASGVNSHFSEIEDCELVVV